MTAAPVPLRGARPGNRAVLYLRQSKEREDSESLETQEYLGRDYCRERGYEVIAVNVDQISGRKWDTRPGVIDTLRLIEEARADVIVLWKWSRLSRNRLHWAVADDRVKLAGGRIESVTEPIDTSTASGRFARGVMTEYAAFQSESIGEVWAETLDRRRRAGLLPSGGERYGYVRDGDTYTPHPDEAAALKEAYERYVAGTGIAALSRWLNQTGRRTKRGSQWSNNSIRTTMRTGFAAGLIHVGGKYYPGAHEAIIPNDLWEAYLARIASNVAPPRGRTRLATGLLRCQCGERMYLAAIGRDGVGDYRCGTAHRGREKCARPLSVKLHLVEQYLSDWVHELPEKTSQLRAAAQAEAENRLRTIEDRAAIERMIAATKKRLASLTVRLIDEKINQDAYDAASAQLNDELTSLRARHLRAAPAPRRDLLELIPMLVAGFDGLQPEAQNRVLKQLIRRVEIGPSTGRSKDAWRARFTVKPTWEPDHE
ncbi:recombinase family protein [Microbacterium excoecariae]|uniref:recombinase family protein n=1 Tax=Microbacterium excoecariae TaxID=2715210 RepID=UPI00140A3C6C|nr:recombinase family protein [Microbacterium excoecariae]NHI16828.1 recombinase family protein [Microbacterium excoecariae]